MTTGTVRRDTDLRAVTLLCPEGCGERVLSTARLGLYLDVDRTPGGMYELMMGRYVQRRSILHVHQELRGTTDHGGGYEPHKCAAPVRADLR